MATAATHVLIILFLSLSTQQVWNATTECDERMQWWDATEDMSVSSRHCSRRMQKILLAVRRDTQEIQARLTYLSACLNRCYKLGKLLEQMLQVRRHSLQTTLPCVELSSERPKVLRRRQFWIIFTCTCAFRHSGRQFYHSRTSKNAPSTTVF